MYVGKSRVSLYHDTYAYIHRNSDEENVEVFKTQMRKYIDILKKIIETDFKKLTDKEFYDLLTKFYSISLTEEDYLEMFSENNGKKYSKICEIPTTITFFDNKTEGRGRDLSWWTQLYQICYVAAIVDDVNFDDSKTYSKEEIKKMVSDKTIVILNEKTIPIEENPNFKEEEYELIPSLDIKIEIYSDNISSFVNDNFSLFGKLLRKKFKKQKVLKDMKELLDAIQEDIDDIFSYTNSEDWGYSQISTICKNWFDESDDKKEYQNLQEKVKHYSKKRK